ncbi:MAG: hypothetical protein JO056_00860 [Alphaproteobacteria bacterium]|nr:hypothetical protein [Alphaproteobacteria bacterium]
MSNDDEIAKRISKAAYGPRSDPVRNERTEEFVVVTAFGASGKHALSEFETQAGPLVGRVAGMFLPCRMERHVAGEFTLFLFSLPTEIVPRARLRVEQRWITQGFGYAITKADPQEFRWTGEEAEAKVGRRVCMDSYPPPQLSHEWIELLTNSPGLRNQPAESQPTSPVTTVPVTPAPSSKAKLASQSPTRIPKRPKAFSLCAKGSAGKQSLARLEKQFGKVPAQLKFSGGDQQSLVFPIAPEGVAGALAAQGEIAPGLYLERETVFVPSAGFARAATVWLNLVLAQARQ